MVEGVHIYLALKVQSSTYYIYTVVEKHVCRRSSEFKVHISNVALSSTTERKGL